MCEPALPSADRAIALPCELYSASRRSASHELLYIKFTVSPGFPVHVAVARQFFTFRHPSTSACPSLSCAAGYNWSNAPLYSGRLSPDANLYSTYASKGFEANL